MPTSASGTPNAPIRIDESVVGDWDDEDCERCESEARSIARRDSGASHMMLEHVRAYHALQVQRNALRASQRQQRQREHGEEQGDNGFDLRNIIRLHARISNSEYFPWMSFDVMMKMHYPTFFCYVFEAQAMAEERKRKQNGGQESASSPEYDAMRLQGLAQSNKPVMWQGETVPIIA